MVTVIGNGNSLNTILPMTLLLDDTIYHNIHRIITLIVSRLRWVILIGSVCVCVCAKGRGGYTGSIWFWMDGATQPVLCDTWPRGARKWDSPMTDSMDERSLREFCFNTPPKIKKNIYIHTYPRKHTTHEDGNAICEWVANDRWEMSLCI